MKVICISDGDQAYDPKVMVGESYSIKRTVPPKSLPINRKAGIYYETTEIPGMAFHESLFAPCSNTDEVELVNQSEERVDVKEILIEGVTA